jgi:hypothetical protein
VSDLRGALYVHRLLVAVSVGEEEGFTEYCLVAALLDGGVSGWWKVRRDRLDRLGMGKGWEGWEGSSGRWMPCWRRNPRNRIVGARRVRIPLFCALRHSTK